MRIAHIFKTTGLSGAEGHILTLSNALALEGFDCRLLVLEDPARRPEALYAAARTAGVDFVPVPLAGDWDMRAVMRLVREIRAFDAQIVHTHMIHGDTFGTLAAGWTRRVLVQSRHNHDPFRRRLPVRLLLRVLSSPARTVIAISESLAAFTRDVEGVDPRKIVTIHYGLDPAAVNAAARPGALRAELALPGDASIIAGVGRLTEQKGWRYLLEAFSALRQQLPLAHLVLAGDGPQRAELEAQAAGLSGTVHFLGWRSDAATVMADADLLAVPSIWEGFGLVTLEAMALNKPVVASRVSALPEIVLDGETGRLVPPGDAPALAGALTALLQNPAKARELGQRGRARLEKEFTVRAMARKHARVYIEAGSRVPEFRA